MARMVLRMNRQNTCTTVLLYLIFVAGICRILKNTGMKRTITRFLKNIYCYQFILINTHQILKTLTDIHNIGFFLSIRECSVSIHILFRQFNFSINDHIFILHHISEPVDLLAQPLHFFN